MQEAPENTYANMQTSGKFIDTLIAQWMKRTGTNVSQHQTEEISLLRSQTTMQAEHPSTEGNKQQALQNQEYVIQNLKRKVKKSEEAEASLSACLEVEMRNREELQTKMNATWESIETITEYFNYISESLASFQEHRTNLSSLYNNVILKQQEAIQKFQLDNAKIKNLENQVAHLTNKSLSLEERLQEAMVEGDKLRKQLENSEYELQLQKKELAQEKLNLVKEQHRLLQECESRLQTIEKEKCDIAKLTVQLENKLQIQEEKMLTEQNRLRKQMEDTEKEFCCQKNAMASAHAEEKKILIEKKQKLLSEYECLQSQLKILEQNKSNITEIIAQKDVLLSTLQDENSTYKNQIEVMMASNKEMCNKCEALVDKQNMCEKELDAKSEKIENLEAIVNTIKQRESNLINDVNRIEKKLTNETDYSKDLEIKLSNTQKELNLIQEQNNEMQKTLEKKMTNEIDNIELQQQLKILQKEKEEAIKRESMTIKNTEILYENMQVKHNDEMSALKSNHETQLLELRNTIDHLNKITNDIRKEKSILNITLINVRAENSNLKNNNELLMERNAEMQGRLREVTEVPQMKSIEDRKQLKDKTKKQPTAQSKSQQKNAKRKYRIQFDPDITEISEADHCNVSTSAHLIISDDENDKQSSSQPLFHAYSIKRESQKEQEAEVTSAGRKFFKSRPVQPRTYCKRRQDF